MNQDTDKNAVYEPNNQNTPENKKIDTSKRNKRALKFGCGCLLLIVIFFFGMIILFEIFATPEERAKLQADREARQANREARQEAAAQEKAERARKKQIEDQRIKKEKEQKSAAEKAKKEHAKKYNQAKKLKIPAFVAAEMFVKRNLKAPSTAKFQGYHPDTVTWWKDNIFLVIVVVDAQNSFGAMMRNTFMCELELIGKDHITDWQLIQIGTPDQVMRNKQLEEQKLSPEAAKQEDERSRLEQKRLMDLERKQEAQQRFDEWKRKIKPFEAGKRYSMAIYYYVPNDIMLYQDKKCSVEKTLIKAGLVFKGAEPYYRDQKVIPVEIYPFQDGERPDNPNNQGFFKVADMKAKSD